MAVVLLYILEDVDTLLTCGQPPCGTATKAATLNGVISAIGKVGWQLNAWL